MNLNLYHFAILFWVLFVAIWLFSRSSRKSEDWQLRFDSSINDFKLDSSQSETFSNLELAKRIRISLWFWIKTRKFWFQDLLALYYKERDQVLYTWDIIRGSRDDPLEKILLPMKHRWYYSIIRWLDRVIFIILTQSHLVVRVVLTYTIFIKDTDKLSRSSRFLFSHHLIGAFKTSLLEILVRIPLSGIQRALMYSLDPRYYSLVSLTSQWLLVLILGTALYWVVTLFYKPSGLWSGFYARSPILKGPASAFPSNGKFISLLRIKLLQFKKLFSWHPGLKSRNWFFLPLLNIGRLIQGYYSASLISSLYLLTLRIAALTKHNGLAYTAKYMKYSSLLVMKFVANEDSVRHSGIFELKISVTRSGIPRIIPAGLRVLLLRRDPKGIKLVLTVFNLFRVLPYPGKVKLGTITDPLNGVIPLGMLPFIPKFWRLVKPPTLEYKIDPFMISSKGTFSTNLLVPAEDKSSRRILDWKRGNSASGFLTALSHYSQHPNILVSFNWFCSITPSEVNEKFMKGIQVFVDLLKNLYTPRFLSLWGSAASGRLAYKEEPGKVRTFAMVDCWTQWILAPLHDWLFQILRRLGPTDGTFDQDGASDRIRNLMKLKRKVYSYDLSAATDRLPIILQRELLDGYLLGLGLHWANILVNRDYSVDPHPSLPSEVEPVRYATGQPMGALSSWAMLAVTHHFIVQYCAYKVYSKSTWFPDYVILGDDIVILDSQVAKEYLKVMKELDVGINLLKSLTSGTGYCEFAKRFLSADHDLSGLPLKYFSSLSKSWSSVLGLISRNPDLTFSTFLRFLGYGSKSSGNFRWTWSPVWSQKRWFYEGFVLLRFGPGILLNGVKDYLLYNLIPYIRHQCMVIDEFTTSRTLWTRPSPLFMKKKKIRTKVNHKGQMFLDSHYLGLRLLAGRLFDVMILPYSQDWSPRTPITKEPHLNLVNAQQAVEARSVLQDILFPIFFGSRFFNSLCHFISQSLSSTEEKIEEWSMILSSSPLISFPLDSLIRLIKLNPSSLFLDKGPFKENNFLRHVFAAKIPEPFELQEIVSFRDFNRILDIKARCWFRFRTEPPARLLAPHGYRSPVGQYSRLNFRAGVLTIETHLPIRSNIR